MENIVRAISQSKIALAILGENSLGSPWVREEIQMIKAASLRGEYNGLVTLHTSKRAKLINHTWLERDFLLDFGRELIFPDVSSTITHSGLISSCFS